MREILFRGKIKSRNEWVEGKGINQLKNPYTEKYDVLLWREDHGWFVCDIETVGQYTGRTDRNDKPIFEGDIVTGLFFHALPVTAVVAFQDGAFGLEWYRGGDIKTFYAFTSICNVEYEVIGNVTDNPELMKGERE